jgi:hypothetical protein
VIAHWRRITPPAVPCGPTPTGRLCPTRRVWRGDCDAADNHV